MDKILLNLLGSAFGRNILGGIILALMSAVSVLAVYIVSETVSHRKQVEALNNKVLAIQEQWSHKFESELKNQIEIAKEALKRQDEQLERFRSIKKRGTGR